MAATGIDLGPAFVQIIPSMRGAQKAIERELGSINVSGATSGWASSISSNLSGAFKTVAKVGVASIAAVGASIAGLAIKGGIDRALAIENAEAKLTGLGHSADSVSAIMGNALASVKGTAYGLGDAATVASSLVASGVQSGSQLEGVLKTVADTAQISGRSMTDIGTIFGSVAARGKLQGDDMLQLMSSGVPVLQFLSEQLGVTSADVSEMVSAGEVDFETFAAAMQAGLGGAALAAGETFTGAWANVQAALSRGGAALMAPILEGLRVVFVALAPVIDQVTAALQPFAEWLGTKVGAAAQSLATWLGQVDFTAFAAGLQGLDVGGVTAAFGDFGATVQGVWSILANGDFTGIPGFEEDSALVDNLFRIREAFIGLGAAMPGVGSALGELGVSAFTVLASSLQFVAEHIDTIIALLPAIIAAFLLWRGATTSVLAANRALTAAQLVALPAQLANNALRVSAARAELQVASATATSTAAENVGIVTRIRSTAATVAQKVATLASSAATKAAAAAQWAMNAAMSANPIMLVVLAIAALVAGLVWFFTQTELGRTIWEGFTQAIGAAWTWLWETVLQPVFTAIGAIFTWLYENVISPIVAGVVLYVQAWAAIFTWLWVNILSPTFTLIGAIFTWLWDVVISVIVIAIQAAIAGLGLVFTWLWVNIIQPTFTLIGAIFTWIHNNIVVPIVTGVILYIQMWGAIFTWLWTTIISPTFTAIGAIFTWLYENIIKPVWSGIQSAIQVVADWIANTLWPNIQTVLGYIGQGFNLLRDGITAAWEAIKNAAMAPVRFIVYSVYRDGIKKTFDDIAGAVGISERLPDAPDLGFATGGIMPGYTPGRDVHHFVSPTGGRLALSGGEPILRPEAGRVLGSGWVHGINRAARKGGTGGVRSFLGGQAFADGGIWSAVGATFSGAGDWLANVASNVAQIVGDPLGAITKLIKEPVETLLAGLGGGKFGDMFAGLPLSFVDKIGEWFATLIKPTTNGAVGNWQGGQTLERLLPYINQFGLMITDTYRDPAYNAAVGGSPSSYHMDAANPAVDVAGSESAMWAFYNAIVRDPGGWRQILWQVAGHYDHVHVAASGGIVGQLPTYDDGGWLQPGISMVRNASGRPEPVFSDSQWSVLEQNVGQGGPEYLVVVDEDGQLIGRMRVEAADVAVKALEGVRS